MAYTNLPPNLYDYFSTINQRIRKLESAPDQAMTTAESAQSLALTAQSLALTSQSVATNAQVQAINAGIQANNAASQATLASSQATYAVTTANGKNTVAYGTAAPPSGTHTTGDLYFQFNGSNQVIAQYTWNGSSWVSNPITSTVIASIDAGKIVSGIITGIEYYNGSGTFHVTPAGALTASSATITGTINAQTGYFGGYGTTGNYWSIGSSGITGVGSATITAGQINGSSIYIGSSGQFQVDAAGNLNASSATITGTVHASSGTIGGWTITGSQLQGFGGTYLDSSAGTIFTDGLISTLGNIGANGTITGTTGLAGGTLAIAGTANMNGLLYNLGHATTTNAANVYMNPSSSLIALVTSSERYKVEILSETIPLDSVMTLAPKTWIDKAEFEANENSSNGLKRILGVIAEDVAQIPVLKDLLVNYNEQGQPDSVNYDRVAVALIPLLKDHETRLAKLEGANGTTTSN